MRNLLKSLLGLSVIGMGIAMSGLALGATGTGPYYAAPSWSQKLPASTRFIVLSDWGGTAVLDRETGLVWEQSPSTNFDTWYNQSLHCINLNTGGRRGWRLPTIQELLSLVDESQSSPALPSGHPFNVQSSDYWSATTFDQVTSLAWFVFLSTGGVLQDGKLTGSMLAWCVRGGPGVDPQ